MYKMYKKIIKIRDDQMYQRVREQNNLTSFTRDSAIPIRDCFAIHLRSLSDEFYLTVFGQSCCVARCDRRA